MNRANTRPGDCAVARSFKIRCGTLRACAFVAGNLAFFGKVLCFAMSELFTIRGVCRFAMN